MQTFLPYSSIYDSAKVLDNKRLNKQILESDQMIKATETNNDKFYKNHPCRKMWDSYINFHKFYRNIMLEEWIRRGFNNNRDFYYILESPFSFSNGTPHWFTDKELLGKICQSHRKALLIKDINHYAKYFPNDIDDMVLKGAGLKGYTKWKRNGGQKIVTASEHKREYIRDNNIYVWVTE